MSRRYQITLKDEIANSLEVYSSRIGVAPSTYIAMLVGMNLEAYSKMMGGVINGLADPIGILDLNPVPGQPSPGVGNQIA